MFVILLTFAERRDQAPLHMAAHNDWLQRGFDDGVFIMSGSLKPGLGGCVMALATTRDEIEARVASDPFVAEGVVSAQVFEIAPGRTDARLAFLSESA